MVRRAWCTSENSAGIVDEIGEGSYELQGLGRQTSRVALAGGQNGGGGRISQLYRGRVFSERRFGDSDQRVRQQKRSNHNPAQERVQNRCY
jgi:hypothetical protein